MGHCMTNQPVILRPTTIFYITVLIHPDEMNLMLCFIYVGQILPRLLTLKAAQNVRYQLKVFPLYYHISKTIVPTETQLTLF